MVVVLVLVVVVVGGGGGGVILGEVKARPKDIISFSLDYISKSKIQTSNPSSSPISLDTPARPADCVLIGFMNMHQATFREKENMFKHCETLHKNLLRGCFKLFQFSSAYHKSL